MLYVDMYQGDCIEVMRSLPDNSIDAIVTDFVGIELDPDYFSIAERRVQRALG